MKGGNRKGAGRKSRPDSKKRYTTRLRPDQIEFLRGLKNAAKWLENLIDGGMPNEKTEIR